MSQRKKTVMKITIALIIFALLFPFVYLATTDFEERAIAWPLLNAAGRRTWVWPTSYYPMFGMTVCEIDGMISLHIHTNTKRCPWRTLEPANEKETRLFLMQIEDMNEYLASHPNYKLNREKRAIALRINVGGATFYISNFDFFDYDRRYDGIRSAMTDTDAIWEYGSAYMSEMRSIYYVGDGGFLKRVGDTSVLANLERIGPACNFTEEELAWFAENLPDCEVVDVPA